MSEQQAPYQKAIAKLLKYRKNDWNVGAPKIEETQILLEKLHDVARLIRRAEKRYQTTCELAAETPIENSEGRNRFVRRAAITKAAAMRLRQYFNNHINEISL